MPMKRHDYIITTHLRERYVQRTNKKYAHLQHCQLTQCHKCDELKHEVKEEAKNNQITINSELRERIGNANEDKSYLNNSRFMEWYYGKYGYENRFEFIVNDDLLFVVVFDRNRKIVVTCVSARTHWVGKAIIGKPKFNKVKTKEEKILESAS